MPRPERRLRDLLELKPGPGVGACVWWLGTLAADAGPDVDDAAALVADRLMRHRCGGAQASYDLWRTRANGGPELSNRDRQRIEPFVGPTLGLPTDAEPKPETHIQAYVAEIVWHLLTDEEASAERTLVRAEGPSLYVTDSGGDGLAVWRLLDGSLTFRLWEIKKHNSSAHVSGTVATAYSQLSTRATRYLAQYTALGRHYDGALRALYEELVDSWVDAATVAGAGVAVSTSSADAPKRRCFSTMQDHFPDFVDPGQLEGMVVGIADFAAFADEVKRIVWSGL